MKRLNLLPRPQQKELAYERVFYSVGVAAAIAVVILLLGVVVQFGVYTYLNRKIQASETQIEELKRIANKSENATVKEQIIHVNSQIQDFANLNNKTPQWSKVLAAFVKNVPAGVRIVQFEADTAKKEIKISGYSPTRDLVIDLYNNINSDKEHFKNINYPLENVTQPANVMFNFTFMVADGVLVKEAAQ
jgi:Tfp pilus assembly protein PilN